jgi:hypothetical protein
MFLESAPIDIDYGARQRSAEETGDTEEARARARSATHQGGHCQGGQGQGVDR